MHAHVGKAETVSTDIGSSRDRHHALDLVRGLAALAVAQFHFMTWTGVATVESMGTFAVYIFFILSGLTMMMVYGSQFANGVSPAAARDFFRKRTARLLPLLLAIAALACVKQAILGQADIPAAILTGTGLMALQMPGFLSNTVGAWSLGIELGFYFVFPIIAILVGSGRSMVVATILLIAAQHLLLWKIQDSAPFWNYYVSNLIFAPFFAMGILISLDRGPRRSSRIWIALLGLAAILGFSRIVTTDLMRDQAIYLGLTVACGLVVWAAWRSRLPAWLVPIGGLLGDISYSLYLTHWIVHDLTRALRLPIEMQWTAFTVVTLLGSYICYRLFENPMRRRLGSASGSPGGAYRTATLDT